ncbi:MAG: hypothetical protein ACOYMV_13590 [Verrucomicrobiia bacterium]
MSLITGGVTARGHDLTVDDTTIAQLFQSATSKGTIPVKLDHKSGIENVCGYVTAFRVEGNKLLGDWHLLKTHPHFATTMEKAERMPSCFGLSAAFVGKEEAREGKKFARCAELLSVDCVTQPAANPDGLFEAKTPTAVDTRTQIHMSTTPPPNPAPAPASPEYNSKEIAALRAENQELAQRLDVVESFCSAMHDAMSAGDDLPGEGDPQPSRPGEGEELDARIGAAITMLETKIGTVEKGNADLLKENTELKAKIEAHELAAKGPVAGAAAPAASPAVEGAPTPAPAPVKDESGRTLSAFEARVQKHVTAGKKQTEAISLSIKESPEDYRNHLGAKGVIEMAAK